MVPGGLVKNLSGPERMCPPGWNKAIFCRLGSAPVLSSAVVFPCLCSLWGFAAENSYQHRAEVLPGVPKCGKAGIRPLKERVCSRSVLQA